MEPATGRWLRIGGPFAPYRFSAFGDQKIACFLAKQRNGSWKRTAGRDGALRSPRRHIAARCSYLPRRLVASRIKFLFWQLAGWDCTLLIAFPQDRSQASAVRPAEVRDKIVDLRIGNFCCRTIHPRLTIQRLAQRRRFELSTFPRGENRESA